MLSIAGSDPSGGAGIQADVKTISLLGCYAACCITSLTAQNTTGVFGVWDVAPEVLEKQLSHVLEDIEMDAIKIGMLPPHLVEVVHKAIPEEVPVVLDPVMVSTSGHELVRQESFLSHLEKLLVKTLLLTPNIEEAEILSGEHILSREDMLRVGTQLAESTGTNVLLKGGALEQQGLIENILFSDTGVHSFTNMKIDQTLHGTGCTLSAAIASFLAQGLSLEKGVKAAMHYISQTVVAIPQVGSGYNPVFHNYNIIGTHLHEPAEHLRDSTPPPLNPLLKQYII